MTGPKVALPTPALPVGGLVQLLASVVLLSSARPLTKTALAASVGFLTTLAVSLLPANLFLHEPFTPDLLAGSALIMTGVAFAAWPRRRTI